MTELARIALCYDASRYVQVREMFVTLLDQCVGGRAGLLANGRLLYEQYSTIKYSTVQYSCARMCRDVTCTLQHRYDSSPTHGATPSRMIHAAAQMQ